MKNIRLWRCAAVALCVLFALSGTAAFGGTVENFINGVFDAINQGGSESERAERVRTLITPERIREVINSGDDINAKGSRDITVLMLASSFSDNPEIIKDLIKAGADVNAKGEYDKTVLMLAAEYNTNPDVIKALVDAGADISAKDEFGSTAKDYAKLSNKNTEIQKLFALIEIAKLLDDVEKGDTEAQFKFGLMYAEGEGVEQDYEQAFYWVTKAAEQGHGEAQFRLSGMYKFGEGVKQDYTQAFYWLKKATDTRPSTRKKFMLACMYSNGEGVDKNDEQAFKLFKEIAEKNENDVLRETFDYDADAMDSLRAAQLNLGLMYAYGIGTNQDLEKAESWLKIPAEHSGDDLKKKAQKALEEVHAIKAEKAQTPTAPVQPQPRAEQPKSESVIEVGIEQLLQDYKDNKVAARRKYDGKRIRLSGFVNKIDEDDDKDIYIHLDETEDPFSPGLRCYFSGSDIDSVMLLKKGQRAIIEGKCRSGENMFGETIAQLVNSRVVSGSQSGSQSTPQPAQSAKPAPSEPKPQPAQRGALTDEEFLKLCQSGTAQEVAEAIRNGANVNFVGNVSTGDSNYSGTPLMIATFFNPNIDVIDTLIKAGADVNDTDNNYGITALMIAVSKQKPNIDVIKMLIEAGADVNAEDSEGETALDSAKENKALKDTEVIKLLGGTPAKSKPQPAQSGALTDAEYKQMLKDYPDFAKADKALNAAWARAKKSMKAKDFEALKQEQAKWISGGRDSQARERMNDNMEEKSQAYATVTLARAYYVAHRARGEMLMLAIPTGNKINVRSKPVNGKVLYQVSSDYGDDGEGGDFLIVDGNPVKGGGENWHKVLYRVSVNEGAAEKANGFIVGRFIRLEPLPLLDWRYAN